MVDGEPWLVASDVAKILGYRNAPDMTRRIDPEDVSTTRSARSTSGGNPNVSIINESGVYNAVFGSFRPEAKTFRRWVTREVLPSIRKTGWTARPSKGSSA